MALPESILVSALGALTDCILLRNEGLLPEAVARLDEIPESIRRLPPFLLERASLLASMFRYEESLADFRTLCETAPGEEYVQFRDDVRDRAIRHFTDALVAAPDDVNSRLRRANVYLLGCAHGNALADYEAILRHHPCHRDALTNRACVLVALDRLEEARECYEKLVKQGPGDPTQWYNLGNVLKATHHLDGAVEAYQRAIWLQPEFAEAQLELAHCLLAAGHFTSGWRQFEWRWKTAQLRPHYLDSAAPAWRGQHDLDGKTILLWAEQGFGDTLQFARFVPQVAERAASVILRIPSPLLSLLQPADDRVTIIDDRSPLPTHDCHCPLMSLPLALGLAAPPPACAYLTSSPGRRERWSSWLGPRKTRRIGIVWAGRRSCQNPANPTRDIPLETLRPLLRIDAEFICLQKEITPPDATILDRLPKAFPVRCSGNELAGFADTAALIDQLDLVVSVDSAVAHLAGALGKPCWLILRHSGEWRWPLNRSDSPWYPSLRVFRQHKAGEWNEVIHDVVSSLNCPMPLDLA